MLKLKLVYRKCPFDILLWQVYYMSIGEGTYIYNASTVDSDNKMKNHQFWQMKNCFKMVYKTGY